MFFLFCQPGLKDKNTIDFLIRKLIINGLNIKKKNYNILDSLKKPKNKKFRENKSFFYKFFWAFIFYIKLSKILKKKKITHIFFDSYSIFELFFFSFAKFYSKKIIIYLRIPYDFMFVTKILFFISLNNLKKKDTLFITDTKELKIHFYNKYQINCEIIPIPSQIKKITKFNKINKINLKNIKILFPGKSRKEKGLNSIISLFSKEKKNFYIDFKFLKNNLIIKNLENKKNLKLNILKENLSYKDYINSFIDCDLIILPYSHKTYNLRSSGVFIDAIKLNKFCLVSKNTWMATMLKESKMGYFEIDKWEIDNLIKKILFYNKNLLKIKKDYKIFRSKIINENSDEKFITKMKKIF